MLQQHDSHTFIFFIELQLIGWLVGRNAHVAEMLRQKHNYMEAGEVQAFAILSGLPGERPPDALLGWMCSVSAF